MKVKRHDSCHARSLLELAVYPVIGIKGQTVDIADVRVLSLFSPEPETSIARINKQIMHSGE